MDSNVCKGFAAAGVAAGVKKNGTKDLALIFSETPAAVAGVFTRNRVKAAPVLLCRERIGGGRCQAVIVNSGNANCCTGERGMADAKRMTALAAEGLGVDEELVLAASTGVIGLSLPMDKIEAATPGLVEAVRAEGMPDFAEAIMTTDTLPKLVSARGRAGGKDFTVLGMAKGAGMIRPDMATLLCFLCTDVAAESDALQAALSESVDRTLNRITIDGDTSTNDTAILMANGRSGASISSQEDRAAFQEALDEVLLTLARELVKDGEGVTKVVDVNVKGALSAGDARAIADTVAHSNLVKTALFGEDANWGRILGAAGRAGVDLDPGLVEVFFDDVKMVEKGVGLGDDAEAEATKVLKKPEFEITVDLGLGDSEASVVTCDFSIDYVKINADYRS
ncbi:MAG: bifunctional glutamate N-acetyltransferase/amino-acid acetyltransferase ArgJ [Desulfobacterales bacterium]|nr:bifunctional glutamate N-acetyltransferase/amino-acid acetyltransferase ArgJ [Desulfobacterales bacterium]